MQLMLLWFKKKKKKGECKKAAKILNGFVGNAFSE
jgi:hypothetical protein